eukprot:TRINITY_DN6944_c0_g1_i1.p1 TRINITY_DN6944_c0_g1~~TRINITY_DN6944_c0_g1_i1.p1  ORF type:complete len:387 (-),score=43.95 TRINITY_DN6944_c0_g1_i1:1543-2703(-)
MQQGNTIAEYEILLDLCQYINSKSPLQSEGLDINIQNIKRHAHDILQLRPSGPRRGKVGTKQVDQGIVYARATQDGGIVLAATLLAAGFVVGFGGKSIKRICEVYDVKSKSWFVNVKESSGLPEGSVRIFYMEGSFKSLVNALNVILAAVDRYKDLVEGNHKDEVVDQKQYIEGIEFDYKPPPIHTMPEAARTIKFIGLKPSEYGRHKAALKETVEGIEKPRQNYNFLTHNQTSHMPRAKVPQATYFNRELQKPSLNLASRNCYSMDTTPKSAYGQHVFPPPPPQRGVAPYQPPLQFQTPYNYRYYTSSPMPPMYPTMCLMPLVGSSYPPYTIMAGAEKPPPCPPPPAYSGSGSPEVGYQDPYFVRSMSGFQKGSIPSSPQSVGFH